MEEFLRSNYTVLIYSVEFIAAITGLFVYEKFSKSYAKYFIWFLCSVVLIEIIGSYPLHTMALDLYHLIDDTLIERNYWWFTIFWTMGSAIFYSWYFQKVIVIKAYSKNLKVLRYFFVIFSIVYILFNLDSFFVASLIPINVFGMALIILSCIMYFLNVLLSSKILVFYKLIDFYIASALFIWFLITTSVTFYEIYFINVDWDFIILRWQVFLFSNFLMYFIFTFALLWCKKPNT